ncbi:helix-turn-helix domain-containing protein [Sphingomonas sp. KR1UV-12]|uniref:Helix-turn-helix domain-containing protein n=1 Tax=Sphingomonas aurea TaxID=3063994 RepID=A0ABT9EP72_9SPHN|nr:helix-turn-helix domain-containing protein [Sphingomonas sp. KR1UV-12]MDP1028765.1 helix-turn-helix domain-containing protein [Sphingomonas sp. KR1UV-12]
MTSFTLGEAAVLALGHVRPGVRPGRPARSGTPHRVPHRTGAPVRRDSIEAGTFEAHFFAVPGKGETDRLLRAARAALDAGRRLKRAARGEGRGLTASERLLAGLSAGAIRVYEEICTLARLNAGRVYPSYDRLAAATALGRATVARALHALEAAGFLVRQRRFKRVEGAGPGPRYEQTSNAYRVVLPQRLMGFLPRWLRPAPVPDDALQHEADTADELAAMHATLSCRELAQVSVGGALGRVLARLGAALDSQQRESHDDPQPLLDSSVQRRAALALSANMSGLTA